MCFVIMIISLTVLFINNSNRYTTIMNNSNRYTIIKMSIIIMNYKIRYKKYNLIYITSCFHDFIYVLESLHYYYEYAE